jgi:uncharacterized protein
MSRQIDYGSLMHRALRGLIHDVLSEVAADGLPGAHHFFITFDTTHAGVDMSDWLRARYSEEMTIVIQHWYENLYTDANGFGVTLNFGDTPEPLYIPYTAVRTFVDPSVEFGLRFESHAANDEDEPEDFDEDDDAESPRNAEIVSLDSWRK